MWYLLLYSWDKEDQCSNHIPHPITHWKWERFSTPAKSCLLSSRMGMHVPMCVYVYRGMLSPPTASPKFTMINLCYTYFECIAYCILCAPSFAFCSVIIHSISFPETKRHRKAQGEGRCHAVIKTDDEKEYLDTQENCKSILLSKRKYQTTCILSTLY